MNTFSVSDSAIVEIQKIFQESKLRDPVAKLYERADAGRLFDDLQDALLTSQKSEEELAAIGQKRLQEVSDLLQSSLQISAWQRADFRADDLLEVNGVTFVIGPQVRGMLNGYCLTFEKGSFLLRGTDNTAHTLRSLAKL